MSEQRYVIYSPSAGYLMEIPRRGWTATDNPNDATLFSIQAAQTYCKTCNGDAMGNKLKDVDDWHIRSAIVVVGDEVVS